ncbi:MAG: 30S ribosomal protein S20 [Mycoplasmataceae bacterium]|jgi:small subunit ribosomal protein S20|nr:30S ribosomal protein S20 [Mycoplasmataceae bacterium]
MANIKANIKNIRKTRKQHARNKSEISKSRSKIKTARQTKSQKDLAVAYKKIDSICAKGKIHKNKANRIKSRLAKAANQKVAPVEAKK